MRLEGEAGQASEALFFPPSNPPDATSLVEAGHRAVAPDLVGFGRSDKPARLDAGFSALTDIQGVSNSLGGTKGSNFELALGD